MAQLQRHLLSLRHGKQEERNMLGRMIAILGDIGILAAFVSVLAENRGASHWLALRICGFSLVLIRIAYHLFKKYQ